MFSRDFFAFCTSLKPIELKALGGLSEGRHMAPGEIIYRSGDPADGLYIINRGGVEILDDDVSSSGNVTYLTRGDVFGDLELLTQVPRRHCARVREDSSLRYIPASALPDMLLRVPTFFRYLCNHLAYRLIEPREVVSGPVRALELSGSLSNFDLVTIYQTIVNSAQTGELSILRENGEALAAFSFQSGRPSGGQFQHLRGEEAYWQLFQTTELQGSFSFSSGKAPTIHVLEPALMERNTDELLITALQARDELDALRNAMPDHSMSLTPLRPHLDLGMANSGTGGALMGQIWERTCSRRTSLSDLYPQFQVCELKIYRAVDELVTTGHLSLTSTSTSTRLPQKVA